MHWGAAFILNLLIVIPFIIIFMIYASGAKRKALLLFADEEMSRRIISQKSIVKDRWRKVLLLLSVTFLILSAARPQIGTRITMARRRGVDVIIAIDTSKSMLAQDIKPNRLEKAKMEIASFIDKLKGDRVGIVTFAGDSFVQCPLTLDYNAAKMFLNVIEPDMMPVPGTNIADAIRTAANAFIKKERKHKVLVLLTDGEDHGHDPVKAAQEAKKEGVVIYTIGIGSKKGEPIPVPDSNGNISGYKKDKDGNVVLTKLDEVTLQKIALITDGKYYHATPGEFELNRIYDEINRMEKKELSSRLFTQYEERFQYFVAITLLLLCIEAILGDRRREESAA